MKNITRLIVAGSTVACAAYTFVYLYRWEWHRAIMAALFLVLAEVAIAAAAILRRLAALDQRLAAMEHSPTSAMAAVMQTAHAPDRPADPQVLLRVRETAPPARPVFAWLAPDRTNVFLPILLGAGVVASALAWLVEGLARATARPVLEQRLAARLGALALPAGGLLGPAPMTGAAPPAGGLGRGRGRTLPGPPQAGPTPLHLPGMVALVVVATAALAFGIDQLADVTQTRPQPPSAGAHTEIELQLYGEVAGAAPDRVVRSLWHTCAGTLRSPSDPSAVSDLGDTRFRIEVPVGFDDSTSRRVHGCLEDAGLDRVQARVVSLRTVSGPQAGPESAGHVEHPAGGD